MTVGELINWLKDFDEDMEVVIGMRQRYGSDFAIEIVDVSKNKVSPFYGDEVDGVVVIEEGGQVGTIEWKER